MSDYAHECWKAKQLGEMRTAREQRRCEEDGITEQMKSDAEAKRTDIYTRLEADPAPADELKCYEELFETASVLGYLYDSDPAFDLVRIRAVKERMAELKKMIRRESRKAQS